MVRRNGPTVTERRAEELKMTIARKAVEIFVTDGDTSATVERIADAAGIVPRTFYRHFPAKEDVVRPLFRQSSSAVIEALRNAPKGGDTVEVLAAAWMAAMDAGTLSPFDRQFLLLMAASPQYRLRWMEVDDDLCEAVAEFLRDRIGPAGGPLLRSLPAYLIVQATRHIFLHWITSDSSEDIEDLLRDGFRLVLRGMENARPGRAAGG